MSFMYPRRHGGSSPAEGVGATRRRAVVGIGRGGTSSERSATAQLSWRGDVRSQTTYAQARGPYQTSYPHGRGGGYSHPPVQEYTNVTHTVPHAAAAARRGGAAQGAAKRNKSNRRTNTLSTPPVIVNQPTMIPVRSAYYSQHPSVYRQPAHHPSSGNAPLAHTRRGVVKTPSQSSQGSSTTSSSRSVRSSPVTTPLERDLQRIVDDYMIGENRDPNELYDDKPAINDESVPLAVRLSVLDRDFNDEDYEILLALDDSIDRSASRESRAKIKPFRCTAAHVGKSCCVCLNNFTARETLKSLPCEHTFHANCLDTWLSSYNKFCPLCKYTL